MPFTLNFENQLQYCSAPFNIVNLFAYPAQSTNAAFHAQGGGLIYFTDASTFTDYANNSNSYNTAGMSTGYYTIMVLKDKTKEKYIKQVLYIYNASIRTMYFYYTTNPAQNQTLLYSSSFDASNRLRWYSNGSYFGICRQPTNSYKMSDNTLFSLPSLRSIYGFTDLIAYYYSDDYGYGSDEGGYTGGTFDDSSDVIAMPTTPTMGVTSAGFVNVYSPTQGELQNFGAELFPDLSFVPDTPVTPTGGITESIEALANVFVNFGNQIPNIVDMFINSNLIQYVIDCHILPVAPTTGGTAAIKVGFKQFTPTPAVVTSDYVDFDCGSLNIGEYYANFIDYAPYTKSKLFLPFVGFVDLAPEFWQAGTLSVKYRFNIIDGSFMAFVIATSSKSKLSNTVVAQFGGNACVHIPITGLNYSSMVSGVVGAAAGIATAQSGVQAASKAIGGAVDVANSKPPMQQSNGYNATTSFLGVRTPYLMIERSVANFSVNYPDEMGIPSNITTDFSNLSGYTKATNIHLDGIAGATQTELDEIAALLAEGVIL